MDRGPTRCRPRRRTPGRYGTGIDPSKDRIVTSATPPLIVFDVNETLLDIDVLVPLFDRIFGVQGRMREWFAQTILYSQTVSLTGEYVPFDLLGGGVPRMLGR